MFHKHNCNLILEDVFWDIILQMLVSRNIFMKVPDLSEVMNGSLLPF